jgi:hypothetical protein
MNYTIRYKYADDRSVKGNSLLFTTDKKAVMFSCFFIIIPKLPYNPGSAFLYWIPDGLYKQKFEAGLILF